MSAWNKHALRRVIGDDAVVPKVAEHAKSFSINMLALCIEDLAGAGSDTVWHLALSRLIQYLNRSSLNIEEGFKDSSLQLIVFWGALQNYFLLIRKLENLSGKLYFKAGGLTAVASYKAISLFAE